jgi:hypothetical protein
MQGLEGELRFYVCNLPSSFDRLHIIPVSDAHLGDPLFSEKHFLRTLKYIHDTPHVRAVLVGDLLNSVIVGKPGNIFRQTIASPQDQRDVMIKYLLPIKDKILGMVTGNHEARIMDTCGVDLSADIAHALNIPYRAEGIGLKIKFGMGASYHHSERYPCVYYLYMTHGYGGARTTAAKAVKGERLSYFLNADVYIMAHDHVTNAAPVVSLRCNQREYEDKETGFTNCAVVARRAIVVKSNAYIKHGGYGEAKGYPPVDLLTPIITLSGHSTDDDYELGQYPTAKAVI